MVRLAIAWSSFVYISAESPVPLEFTPVLGILIGVVLTLFFIALVIILVLRIKYKSSVAASRKRWGSARVLQGRDVAYLL